MAVSEEFINQLRQVFDVCDVDKRGSISLSHLLQLAGEHFGSSQNSVTSAVACLGVTGDAINFPQFCEVVATILTNGGPQAEVSAAGVDEEQEVEALVGVEVGVGPLDTVDGLVCSTPLGLSRRRRRKYGRTEGSRLSPGTARMPGEERCSPASFTDLDSALGGSTASPDSTRKTHSGCSSMSDREEENFECYGEADDVECDSDSARMGDEVDGTVLLSPPHSLPPSTFSRRNSWVRRSLRGSPSSAQEKVLAPRRWASFRQRVVSASAPLTSLTTRLHQ